MNYPMAESASIVTNWAIIDRQPVTVSPNATFLEILRKFDQGCDYLIVMDCHIPLGVITAERVIKIITTGVNIYSLRAKSFCQSFPCQKEAELTDIFTIAQGILKGNYDVFGCLNNHDDLSGVITPKSLINHLETDVLYQRISLQHFFKPNLILVDEEDSILEVTEQYVKNNGKYGFIFKQNQKLKIINAQHIIGAFLKDNWNTTPIQNLVLGDIPSFCFEQKLPNIIDALQHQPAILLHHKNLANHQYLTSSFCELGVNNIPPSFVEELSLITPRDLIEVFNPVWQQNFLREQQQELDYLKTAVRLEQKQVEQEKLLSSLSYRIRQSLRLEDILDSTVNEVRSFLDCDRVIIYQLYPDGDGVIIAESAGKNVMSILGRVVRDHCFAKDFIQPYLNGRIQATDNVFTANLSPCHLDLLLGIQVQANLVVPIIFHDRLWGLLAAQNSFHPRHWQKDELDLLQKLAAQVAIAIQQSEYAQKALQVAEYQTAIAHLGNTALISNNLEILEKTTVKIIADTLEVEYCNLLELQANQAAFVLKAGRGWKDMWLGVARIGASPRWMPGYAMTVKQPVITEDLLVETRFSPPPFLHNTNIVSGAMVNIGSNDNYFGIIGVYSKKPRKFSPEEINFLQTVANVLATAIERTKSQRQLDYFFNLSLDMFCIAGVDGSFKRVNSSFSTTLGYAEEEMINKNMLSFIHPDDVEVTAQELEKLSHGFPSQNFENRWRTNEGLYRWLAWKSLPYEEGTIYAVARDITLAKQAEEQLRSLNEELETRVKDRTEELEQTTTQLRTFVQTAGTVLVVLNQNYRIMEWNEEAEKIFGWTRESVLGEDYFLLFVAPSDRDILRTKLDITLLEGTVQRNLESKVMVADGTERTLLWNVNRFTDGKGEGIGIIACGQDIEEVRLAQLRLKLSEERFRSIFNQAAVGIVQVSLPGKLVLVNDKFTQLVGYSRNDLSEMDFHALIHPDDVSDTLTDLSDLLASHRATFEREIRIKRPNDDYIWIYLTMSVVWVSVEPSYFIAVINDISDRKQAEESLQKSESRLNSVLSSLQDVVWSMSLPDMNLRYINPACEILYGHSPASILANRGLLLEMVAPEYRQTVEDTWQEILEGYRLGILQNDTNKSWELEYKIILSTGKERWIRERSHIVYDKYGRAVSIDGISTDVTQRHEAEEKLFKSLQEKEVLLKEIHHRVKNNLYVISGLLNLQSSYVEDAIVRNLFHDSQNRIQTMAVIHEQLYQSDDLSEINLADYINRLVSNLFLSYNSNREGIKPVTNLAECSLNIETAIPAGLLINELVTNAFKHAFPHGKGQVTINLSLKDNQHITLEVKDDGKGFPEDLNWEESPSLGLRLVRLLTQQLDAEIEVTSAKDEGTCFCLQFFPIS
ncbi:signal transduction histidine kinase [Cyanobacterium stanieri PCC 7202]|uniref:histidine kinase n=1 Tax=Cyanobacterium stanieri (strain ATCC 29140 / PCC 7202) TaxID=292563 RepID=K9YKV4_CYASC|nr:signal transduction histidine kinase [Cyanobacterium stanieri PCC 7202]